MSLLPLNALYTGEEMHYQKPFDCAGDTDACLSKNRKHLKQRNELFNTDRLLISRVAERRNRQTKLTAKQTTQSLNSLVHRMNDEVKVSEQATMILTTSSSTLKDTSAQITNIGATIKIGGKLITKYGRRETTDKILLFLALLLYFGVILYILKKRIFMFLTGNYW